MIGSPVRLDTATQKLLHPSVARVCLEIDVSKELPTKLHIQSRNHEFFQRVIYGDVPLFLLYMLFFGTQNRQQSAHTYS